MFAEIAENVGEWDGDADIVAVAHGVLAPHVAQRGLHTAEWSVHLRSRALPMYPGQAALRLHHLQDTGNNNDSDTDHSEEDRNQPSSVIYCNVSTSLLIIIFRIFRLFHIHSPLVESGTLSVTTLRRIRKIVCSCHLSVITTTMDANYKEENISSRPIK